jgi:hypothetical protein
MPEGVEVHPDHLRRVAAQLRDAVGRLGAAAGQAADGAGAAANGAGDGPLAQAADVLAARLDVLLGAVTGNVTDGADALDAASTQYLVTDQAAARDLGGAGGAPGSGPPILVPGLAPR